MAENTAETQGIAKAGNFFSESIEELRKVHRPTKQETVQATIVTLGMMVFISVVLALFDFVFRKLVQSLF